MNELFSLQAQIGIEIQRALDNLTQLGLRASDVASRIETELGGTNEVTINTTQGINSLTRLNSAITRQSTELETLKRKYQDAMLAQGKDSQQARELATQIDALSRELQENRNRLNETERAANELDNSMQDLNDSSNKTAKDGFTVLRGALANLLASGFAKVAEGIKRLVSSATSYQSQMEQYTTSFEVMTGSAKKAAQVTSKLGEVAASTPFELTDLADTTQLLMNYGFTADDAIDKMQMLGDISQGSSDKMTRISAAYGQMSSAGKVSLEDVKQMIEAGFNPLQEISESTGESMSSLYSRISKGTISIDEITASMERSTSQGGKYFGSMDKQSQTLSGRLSTLKDTINSSLGTALSGVLQKLADDILPKITVAMEKVDWEDVGNKLTSIFEKLITLGSWIINHFDLVATLIVSVGTAFLTWKVVGMITSLINVIKGLTTAQSLLNVVMAMNPIGLVIAAIAGLVAAFIMLWKNCEGFRNFWIGLWDGIKTVVSSSFDWINGLFKKVISGFNSIKTTATNVWNGIKNAITASVNAAYNVVKGVINKIRGLFNFTWSLPKLKVPKFSISPSGWKVGDLLKGKIPKLGVSWHAEGGVFEKPTLLTSQNGIHGVAEAGPETIAPINTLQTYVKQAVQEETSGMSYNIQRLYDIVANYFPQFIDGMDKDVVLDSGALVGNLAPQMNTKLGEIYKANNRGR